MENIQSTTKSQTPEKKPKVIGIVCSPRVRGNTEVLVKEALAGAKDAGAEVELIRISGKTISPCDACGSCFKTGKCRIKDDMQEIYLKELEADGIIYGTPVYFWSLSAQAKAIIDRHRLYRDRQLRNKIGAVMVVTGRAGGSYAFTAFQIFFNLQRLIFAGGAIGYGYDKGAVKQDERAMAEAKAVGRVVVRYIYRHQKGEKRADLEARSQMPPRKYRKL